MQLQAKESLVSEYKDGINNSSAAFLVAYKGCSCAELTGLRNELRTSGAHMSIVKNTLAKLAIDGTQAEGLAESFSGPTAVIWAPEDPVSPAKVLTDFVKEKEGFELKSALVDGQVVDSAQVEQLAKMPSKEELLAKLLSLLNAPATKLLQTINAPASEMVRLLGAWKSKLEEQ